MLDLGQSQATRVRPAKVLRLGSFQGGSQLHCYEVAPQQLALSPGKLFLPSPSPFFCFVLGGFSPPLSFPFLLFPPFQSPGYPDSAPLVSPKVTQCLLESVLRGAALVPRRALAVMGCEVLRVLQLSDTAIMPISYHVPRKVRRGLGEGLGRPGGFVPYCYLPVCHQAVEFYEDLFPDTAGCVPASEPHDWWAGSNQQVGPRPD